MNAMQSKRLFLGLAAAGFLLMGALCGKDDNGEGPSQSKVSFEADTAAVRTILDTNHCATLGILSGSIALTDTVGGLLRVVRLNLNKSNLAGGTITVLPAAVAALAELKTLSIDSNAITALPPELGTLHKLSTIFASGNQLTDLPTAIGQCMALKQLFLNGNLLNAIPAALQPLRDTLDLLEVNDNAIAALPPWLTASALQIMIDGNKLCALSPADSAWLYLHASGWNSTQVCQ
jgi:Leucine-rich repeat (LRR) protein